MPKPYPNPANMTQAIDVAKYANNVTQGLYGTLSLVTIAVVAFILCKLKFSRNSDSLLIASLISLALGSLMWVTGFVKGEMMIVFIVLMVVGFIWGVFEQ